MPRLSIEQLSDSAYIWIFGISPSLNEQQSRTLLSEVDGFLDGWSSHGRLILSARELREGAFLIIAAESDGERSGCSIDRLFGSLARFEKSLKVSILDGARVFYRDDRGFVQSASRDEFSQRADANTVVFDTTAERLGQLRGGGFEVRAGHCWHARLLSA